jgi:hypothetical protein
MAKCLQRSAPAPASERIRKLVQHAEHRYARAGKRAGNERGQDRQPTRPEGEHAVVEDDGVRLRLVDLAANA